MKDSIAIGDSKRDLVAAKLAGIENRYFIINEDKYNSKDIGNYFYTAKFKSLFDCAVSISEKDFQK